MNCENCEKTANGKTIWVKSDGINCFDCGKPVGHQYRNYGHKTLRDEFAMAALEASKNVWTISTLDEREAADLAASCFKVADAFLGARKA